jgi:hypothetical protein
MPITQARMIAVLDEANVARTALRDLRDAVREIISSAPSAIAAVTQINALLAATRVPPCSAIDIERAHFSRVAKRNVSNARYMRQQRRGMG